MRASARRWPHPVLLFVPIVFAVACVTPPARPRLVGAPPIPAAGVVVDLTPSWPRSGAAPEDLERAGCHVVVDSRRSVAAIEPGRWLGPVVVIEIEATGESRLRSTIDVADLERIEARGERIGADARVFLRTDFPSQADDLRDRKAAFVDPPVCPGFTLDALRWLIHERGVRTIGTDAPRLVANPDDDVVGMRMLVENGGVAVLNLAGLERLPPRGATVVIAPIPRGDRSTAPARVLAIVPR